MCYCVELLFQVMGEDGIRYSRKCSYGNCSAIELISLLAIDPLLLLAVV